MGRQNRRMHMNLPRVISRIPSFLLLESISQTNTSLLNSFFPLETPAPLIKSSICHTQRIRAIRSIIHTFYLLNEPRSKTSRLSGLVHSPYLTSLKPRMRFFICTDVWLAAYFFALHSCTWIIWSENADHFCFTKICSAFLKINYGDWQEYKFDHSTLNCCISILNSWFCSEWHWSHITKLSSENQH